MRRLLPLVLVLLALPAAAQDAPNPLSTYHRFMFGVLKTILIRSAEKMPEEHYSFKPADAVRTYGQIVGHVADAQYTHCSIVLGEKNPVPKVEQTASTKAELVAALKDALAYCDRAYEAMNDAVAAQPVKSMGGEAPTLGLLTGHLVHSTEHYGNLVTYLRMKGIVPPTSEPGFRPGAKK